MAAMTWRQLERTAPRPSRLALAMVLLLGDVGAALASPKRLPQALPTVAIELDLGAAGKSELLPLATDAVVVTAEEPAATIMCRRGTLCRLALATGSRCLRLRWGVVERRHCFQVTAAEGIVLRPVPEAAVGGERIPRPRLPERCLRALRLDDLAVLSLAPELSTARVVGVGVIPGSAEAMRAGAAIVRALIERGSRDLILDAPAAEVARLDEVLPEGRDALAAALRRPGIEPWVTAELLDLLAWIATHNRAAADQVHLRGMVAGGPPDAGSGPRVSVDHGDVVVIAPQAVARSRAAAAEILRLLAADPRRRAVLWSGPREISRGNTPADQVGYLLARSLGAGYRAVAITPYRGAVRAVSSSSEAGLVDLSPANPAGLLEAALSMAGQPLAWIDLRACGHEDLLSNRIGIRWSSGFTNNLLLLTGSAIPMATWDHLLFLERTTPARPLPVP